MSESTHLVCLAGPTKAGKSTLLKVFQASLREQMHGYQSGVNFKVKDDESDSAYFTAWHSSQLQAMQDSFFNQFEKEEEATPAGTFKSYKFKITRTDSDQSVGVDTKQERPIEIVDASGEFFTEGTQRRHVSNLRHLKEINEAKEAFEKSEEGDTETNATGPEGDPEILSQAIEITETVYNYISESDTLVLVFSLTSKVSPTETNGMEVVVARFVETAPSKPKRIIVVWSHLDLLLSQYNNMAYSVATDRECLHAIVAKALLYNQRLSAILTEYKRQSVQPDGTTNLEILHVPVGTHGFVRESGAANMHLDSNPLHYIDDLRMDDEYEQLALVRDHWTPFLAADPFLIALFGQEGHAYCFVHENLTGEPAPAPTTPGSDQNEDKTRASSEKQRGFRAFFGL